MKFAQIESSYIILIVHVCTHSSTLLQGWLSSWLRLGNHTRSEHADFCPKAAKHSEMEKSASHHVHILIETCTWVCLWFSMKFAQIESSYTILIVHVCTDSSTLLQGWISSWLKLKNHTRSENVDFCPKGRPAFRDAEECFAPLPEASPRLFSQHKI